MRTQTIRTAPRRLVVTTYLTAKGVRLKKEGAKKDVLSKYTKNRLIINPDSKPFRERVNLSNNPKGIGKTRQIQHAK